MRSWSSFAPLKSWIVPYDSKPASATNVVNQTFQEMMAAGGARPNSAVCLSIAVLLYA